MTGIYICGVRRGRYKMLNIRKAYKGKLPKIIACDGCRKKHNIRQLKVRRWTLTKKELEEAVEEFDMFSLDMPDKILCKRCLEKQAGVK